MFCRSLFVLLCFFCWPLCCLFFFDIWILITPLVSSKLFIYYCISDADTIEILYTDCCLYDSIIKGCYCLCLLPCCPVIPMSSFMNKICLKIKQMCRSVNFCESLYTFYFVALIFYLHLLSVVF